jgi:hypothetical protein
MNDFSVATFNGDPSDSIIQIGGTGFPPPSITTTTTIASTTTTTIPPRSAALSLEARTEVRDRRGSSLTALFRTLLRLC